MSEEQATGWVKEVGRLLPGILRCLFAPPHEQSPLWDLPLPQMRALHTLRRHGALTMREVAAHLGVAMSTVTQLADRLEDRGLVERQPDTTDRRVVRLALTEHGRAALDELHGQRDAQIAAAMDRLAPEERQAVLTGLQMLERAAREGAPSLRGPHPLWEVVTGAIQPEGNDQGASAARSR
jgi:DNA-binding MarR family transcriptional regulator